ncbi:sensor histidine kinase [Actinocatenispora rupis]|uniref:histidine kinase n=1 Tax=Actinocatenispora rupis TaxID=519421 RepID=A0A8J3JBW5_9ACTN|nr:sensor histidine kinase [Actinocatenispora rupis]GID11973.1 ATPase [Actinocatenispora rupis]
MTRRPLAAAARLAYGVLLGALTAPVDLAYLLVAGVVVVASAGRARSLAGAGAGRLARLELRRAARWLGTTRGPAPTGARAVAYLAARGPLGVLGAAILGLIGYGTGASVLLGTGWLTGDPIDDIPPTGFVVAYAVVAGLVLAFLAVQGVIGVAALERRLARWAVTPDGGRAALRHRIAELSTSRAEIVAAVDDERRRIERDLHDGVQQRLVALGMLLGRARRAHDPDRAAELLRTAHEESQLALVDLREVAWRVYPTALDDAGLSAALENVAERAGVPVTVDYRLGARPTPATETVAYFVVCEAVTNAAKHAGADLVTVHIGQCADRITVVVRDDGRGGADPYGAGLSGLSRRVAALDGTLRVDSPPGGPTTVTADLPYSERERPRDHARGTRRGLDPAAGGPGPAARRGGPRGTGGGR